MQAKGLAEEIIRQSGVPFTIVRSAIVFGAQDHFTVPLARLIRSLPFVFPVPAIRTVIQPLWVEDLAACLSWTVSMPELKGQTIEIGGGEYFSVAEVLEIMFGIMRLRRRLVPLSIPVLRGLLIALGSSSYFPFSSFFLDYISVNRTCPVENITRVYGLMPARFAYRLEYLTPPSWRERLSHLLMALRAREHPH
jgi:NADH dehydrogenase